MINDIFARGNCCSIHLKLWGTFAIGSAIDCTWSESEGMGRGPKLSCAVRRPRKQSLHGIGALETTLCPRLAHAMLEWSSKRSRDSSV